MSNPKVISVKSPPLRIGQWTTEFNGKIPLHAGGEGPEPIAIADAHACLVLDRWVYVIAQRATDTNRCEVVFELYVDKGGKIWVTEGDHHAPIPERGRSLEGHATHTVQLPLVGPKRDALWMWIFLSPFRLPQAAVLGLEGLGADIAKYLAPLWEWQKGSGLPGVVTSRDGWSLQETPLWLTVPPGLPGAGTQQRVALGVDAFALATVRSPTYVRAYEKYKREFEPESPADGSEYQRLALARLIDQTALGSEDAQAKYREHIDITKLNKALRKDDKRRKKLVKAYEEAAFELCEVMRSPLFRLLEQASISDEGLDASSPSPPLQILFEVLGRCTRALNGSVAGRGLLREWAELAHKHPDHFINHVMLPTTDPSVPRFKAFRWGSKAIASVLAQFLAHHVATLRGSISAPLMKDFERKLMRKLGTLAGTATLADFSIVHTLNPKRIGLEVSAKFHTGRVDVVELEMPFLHAGESDWIEAWIDAGEFKDFGVGKAFLDAKFLAALLLDIVNVSLALGAVRDSKAGAARGLALGALTAHSFNLVASIGDEYAKTVLKDKSLRVSGRVFMAVRGAASAFFAISNIISARGAWTTGDRDKALMLGIAAAAEIASAAGYFISAVATTATAGPWISVFAGLVAAGAYIAAQMFTDDELATFLSHSEWGVRPYAEPELRPTWSKGAVLEWRTSYVEQSRLLLKLLTKFTVRWASHGISSMGINVDLSVVTPESTLHVKFVGRRNGVDTTDDHEFRLKDRPRTFPCTVVARPEHALRAGEPPDLIAVVTFRLHPGEVAETVIFTLRRDGVDQPDDDVSSLD